MDEIAKTLAAGYDAAIRVVASLDETGLSRPTRAEGWTVRDLLVHMKLDAQRCLVTLATPADGDPDVDAVTYWRDYPPGNDEGGQHAEFVRNLAAAYSSEALVRHWTETEGAAARAALAAPPGRLVSTQGHVMRTPDFLSTLVVELTIHHLDLVVDLPASPGPTPAGLRETRRVLEGLLGEPLPAEWDDTEAVLRASGRHPSDDPRLPLIG